MRILVVEDERKMSGFLKKGLSEAGYAVDVSDTGKGGEELAAANPYDLIILDVMLGDQDGIQTAKNLREFGFIEPILMLTALGGTKDKVKGLDAGADDYLTKPFAFEELLARVRALLRRKDPGTTTLLQYDDLEMDLVTRDVKRGGKKISLTPKEFSLLEYLLRNPGRPISRTTISEHVWDMHFDSESNVIDVYVAMLRKKVDQGSQKKLIQTVVGIGYVLKNEKE